jgi:hypothetical protein
MNLKSMLDNLMISLVSKQNTLVQEIKFKQVFFCNIIKINILKSYMLMASILDLLIAFFDRKI